MDVTISLSSGSSTEHNASSASVKFSIDSILDKRDERLLFAGPSNIPAKIACTTSTISTVESPGTSLDGPSSSQNWKKYFFPSPIKSELNDRSSSYSDKRHVRCNSSRSDQFDITKASSGKQKKLRRHRTVFSAFQLRQLENAFKENTYLDFSKREELSKRLELGEFQVQIWFQNRRAKERQREKAISPLLPHCELSSGPQGMPNNIYHSKGYPFPVNAFWPNVNPHQITGTSPMLKQAHSFSTPPYTRTSSLLAQNDMRPFTFGGVPSGYFTDTTSSASAKIHQGICPRPESLEIAQAEAAATGTSDSSRGSF